MTPARAGWLVLRFAVGVALLVWLSRSGVIAWSRIAALLAHPGLVALALVLFAGAIAVTAWRLCVLATPLGLRIGFGASLRLLLIGTCFSVFMPGSAGGDLARIYLALQGQQGRRAELTAVLIFDRIIGLIALLLFPLAAALASPAVVRIHPGIVDVLARAAAIVALAVVGAIVLWGPVSGTGIARRVAALPLGGLVTRATAALRTYRRFPGKLVLSLALSFVAAGLAMAVMLVLARAVGIVGGERAMLMLLPIGFLINALPLTPGGLGVGEVAMDRLFGAAGLSGGAAVLLSWRLMQLVPAAVGLVLYVQGHRDFVASPEEDPAASAPASGGTGA